MPRTTIDIEDLKRAKKAVVDRDITLKEIVNRAIEKYLQDEHEVRG